MTLFKVFFERDEGDEIVNGHTYIREENADLAARRFLERIDNADVDLVENFHVTNVQATIVDDVNLQKY